MANAYVKYAQSYSLTIANPLLFSDSGWHHTSPELPVGPCVGPREFLDLDFAPGLGRTPGGSRNPGFFCGSVGDCKSTRLET